MADTNFLNGLLVGETQNALNQSSYGLRNQYNSLGLSPYGLRHNGLGAKGKGFFGLLSLANNPNQFSTEISASSDIDGNQFEYPLLVPTLSRNQIIGLLSGQAPTQDIYKNALAHALSRQSAGLSPFAQPNELRWPIPNY